MQARFTVPHAYPIDINIFILPAALPSQTPPQERVKVAEKSAETQVQNLVAETNAVKSIRQRLEDDETSWGAQKQQGELALEARKKSLEDTYVHRKARDELLMKSLEEQVSSLQSSLRNLDSLASVVRVSGTQSLRKECEALRKRCEVAEEALSAERLAATRDQEQRAQMENLSMGELRQYRNKFHHLRRVATEQQATLAAEKRALLEQIEDLTSHKGARRLAAEVTDTFRKQMEASEKASRAREEALAEEVQALQSALSHEREQSEKRARASARELRAQAEANEQRLRVLQEQHAVESEGKFASTSAMRKLEHRCRELEDRSSQERVEMERAMEQVRKDAIDREEELQRHLASARSDHLGEMRRLQVSLASFHPPLSPKLNPPNGA